MAALVTWWRGPENAAGAPVRLATFTFDIQGIVPVAYAVFAVALGIAAGALLRRVLPAMAATFTVFTGLRFLIGEYARPHYLTPVSRSYPPERQRRTAWLPGPVERDPRTGRQGLHRRPGLPAGSRGLPRERAASRRAAEFLPGVPPVSYPDPLPAREQVLDLPGHRDGHLHRACRRPRRGGLPHGPGPGCVTSQDTLPGVCRASLLAHLDLPWRWSIPSRSCGVADVSGLPRTGPGCGRQPEQTRRASRADTPG